MTATKKVATKKVIVPQVIEVSSQNIVKQTIEVKLTMKDIIDTAIEEQNLIFEEKADEIEQRLNLVHKETGKLQDQTRAILKAVVETAIPKKIGNDFTFDKNYIGYGTHQDWNSKTEKYGKKYVKIDVKLIHKKTKLLMRTKFNLKDTRSLKKYHDHKAKIKVSEQKASKLFDERKDNRVEWDKWKKQSKRLKVGLVKEQLKSTTQGQAMLDTIKQVTMKALPAKITKKGKK